MKYKLSPEGLESLIHEEGYRNQLYYDVKKLATIGVGHLITSDELANNIIHLSSGEDVGIYTTWTKKQVMQLLRDDIHRFRTSVNKLSKYINQGQFDALISFSFNIGVKGFERSTAFKRIKKNNHKNVPSALLMWKKPKEIINRRKREATMYRMASLQSSTTDTNTTECPQKLKITPVTSKAKLAGLAVSLNEKELQTAMDLLN